MSFDQDNRASKAENETLAAPPTTLGPQRQRQLQAQPATFQLPSQSQTPVLHQLLDQRVRWEMTTTTMTMTSRRIISVRG